MLRKYRCPESESDFPVVARTAEFEGRGGIHTAEGGGGGQTEPQGVPREVRAVPKPFPDGFQEDRLRDGGQNIGLPVDMLVDTVSRMQKDLAMLREENRSLRTPATSQVIQAPRRAALTTTKVSRFDGTTSWEQYHQVFEAIVRLDGWDNDTAALQLFSHLEGDALNVAHLVPLARRLSRSGLLDALTAHYGSPGWLADDRRQFERNTRTVGEDPAIFATALETLAVKAFGDMGQTARLRLIRDRFIAGHSNCDLRRHLDSVSPETPIRNVVDQFHVWESHTDPAVRRMSKPTPDPMYPAYAVGDTDNDNEVTRVTAVTGLKSDQNQLADLLQRVISSAEHPAPKPEISDMAKLLQQLGREALNRPPAVVNPPVPTTLEQMLHSFLDGQPQRQRQPPRQRPTRRDWTDVVCFSCGTKYEITERTIFRIQTPLRS